MLTFPLKKDIETKEILKKSIKANAALAKLNGVAKIIPNQLILINTLALQEAKDSSNIENIVTTHDELYLVEVGHSLNKEIKEVQNYNEWILYMLDAVEVTANNSSKLIENIHTLIQK